MTNTLYYGDNLDVLRELQTESVDLIYLDPPFNSSRNYNVLFRSESGEESEAQVGAFVDTWHWNKIAKQTYDYLSENAPNSVSKVIGAMWDFMGESQMMAYLVMMTARLVELHRVLKPTGSLYLHCDPSASHYLKVMLDAIFDARNFKSEIIWQRTTAHNSAKRPGPVHDVILFYTKTDEYVWNQQYQPYTESYIQQNYSKTDPDGRHWKSSDLTGSGIRNGQSGETWRGIDVTSKGRHWMYIPTDLEKLDMQGKIYWSDKPNAVPRLKQYLDEMPGIPLQDIWNAEDIPALTANSAERLGYPTQKPLVLLERIIKASSNPGDIVLDPFCGCGTAIIAAQGTGRQWIGIDVTAIAIALIRNRIRDMYSDAQYKVVGLPKDLESARQLAHEDENDGRYQFQFWALSVIEAKPLGGDAGSKKGKKGADRGIDGVITFIDENNGKQKRVLVQVKSGHVKSGDIRDLRGVLDREQAAMGVFLTLEEPTSEMKREAVSAGMYHSPIWNRDYPRLQIITIAEVLAGKRVDMPATRNTYKRAGIVDLTDRDQPSLPLFD